MEELQRQIKELQEWKRQMESSSSFPLNVQQAMVGRGFLLSTGSLNGILKGNGTLPVTAIVGTNRNVFVASTSGGAVVQNMIVTNGIVTT